MAFKGKPPGGSAGEISRRTEALRPTILLTPKEAAEARRRRREGQSTDEIAAAMDKPVDEVEKVLVQMRMPRPETTRGTLNVTLAAHRLIMRERKGDEPIWTTMDRLLDELLRLRQLHAEAAQPAASPPRRAERKRQPEANLPLLAQLQSQEP
ncbi:MAG TPA: hypothetical protein VE690_22495 [Rhodopila sp.]|nr:hypothetical protein [Rhodopila sp.]